MEEGGGMSAVGKAASASTSLHQGCACRFDTTGVMLSLRTGYAACSAALCMRAHSLSLLLCLSCTLAPLTPHLPHLSPCSTPQAAGAALAKLAKSEKVQSAGLALLQAPGEVQGAVSKLTTGKGGGPCCGEGWGTTGSSSSAELTTGGWVGLD